MNNILTKSPIDSRLFIWVAQYNNEEYFYEYDKDFNQFDDIQKDILKNFGMIGMNMIMNYDVSTGVFDICGRKIGFVFRDTDNNEIRLTNTDNIYNDCISYKSAERVIVGRNQGSVSISSYNFGYKIRLDNLNLKVIVHIPAYTGKVNIDISITPDDNIEGELLILRNNEYNQKYSLKLVKNQMSNVNWTVV